MISSCVEGVAGEEKEDWCLRQAGMYVCMEGWE